MTCDIRCKRAITPGVDNHSIRLAFIHSHTTVAPQHDESNELEQVVTGGYRWLQVVTGSYRGLQGVTGGYRITTAVRGNTFSNVLLPRIERLAKTERSIVYLTAVSFAVMVELKRIHYNCQGNLCASIFHKV